MDTRNIIDEFKGIPTEEIKVLLNQRRRPYSVLLSNLEYCINTGNIVRTCNALSVSDIYIYGRKQYDKRGTVGTHHYERITFLRTVEDLQTLNGRNLVGIDNVNNAVSINKFVWPDNPILVFGNEATGIPEEVSNMCMSNVCIPQTGSVRSLNVATAAGIAIYDICLKNNWL